MPRNYKRKTTRQSWSESSMKNAIEAVKKREMGWLLAARTFGVPQATLRRHALEKNKTLKPLDKGLGRYRSVFPPEVERQLVEHLKLLETRLFGFTCKEVQELAYQLAEKNGYEHCFNKETKKAGQEWLDGFRRRNKDISLRKPEPTSAARAQAFNKPQIERFFKVLQEVIDKNNITPNAIYNVDESALSTVQRPQKVFATTGRKQVGSLTSAEKGSHSTVVCCMSATGNFVPPCIIFPRKNMRPELIDDAPTGTLGVAQESGWMTTAVFYKWLKHFQSYVKASVENKVLLILDGHISHKGIDCLTFAKENGIILVCLPPHCTHRIQPLDVSFFGPLKTYFNQEITTWLKCHPGRVVTQYQIGFLFNSAYGKAATIQNACNGYKKTGIWPVDSNVFPDYLFEPAETTNIPEHVATADLDTHIENNQTMTQALETLGPSTSRVNTYVENVTFLNAAIQYSIEPGPSTSEIISHVENKRIHNTALQYPIESISPIPVGQYVAGQGLRKPRKRQTDLVLTSTPNMEEIKFRNCPKSSQPKEQGKRKVKKILTLDTESEEEEIPATVDDDDDEDCACIYCNDLFSRSKPKECWIKCMSCAKWAHASCADVPKKTKHYFCELCA